MMTKAKINELFRRLAQSTPTPRSELNYTNPYTLLIAVILSAQATDKGVNKATESLFKIIDTPEKMLTLGEESLKNFIRTIGLYTTKASNILRLSRILIEKFNGLVPQDRESLESLPGVGRKTANVVLNVAFGNPTIAVDTHVFRVSNRTGLARGKSPLVVERTLLQHVPKQWMLHAHHWLILHGRYICTARNPKCSICPLQDLCDYYQEKEPRSCGM